jgi:replication factor C subunit 2/4
MPEYTKLEYIKVCLNFDVKARRSNCCNKEIGFTHMRILEGVGTLIQLAGLAARLCKMVCGIVIVFCVGRSYFDQRT